MVDDAVTVVAEKPLELFKRLEKSAAWASVICPLPSCRGNAGSPAVFGTGKSPASRVHHRWALDISIIIADETYFRAFCIVCSVFQCVLESSGTVT